MLSKNLKDSHLLMRKCGFKKNIKNVGVNIKEKKQIKI